MTREERLMPNGIPRWIRCYDMGEDYCWDRYTVVYTSVNGYYPYVGMGSNPFHPQGFGQHGEGPLGPIDRPKYSHLGKKIGFKSLPIDCQKLVIEDYKEIWNL